MLFNMSQRAPLIRQVGFGAVMVRKEKNKYGGKGAECFHVLKVIIMQIAPFK